MEDSRRKRTKSKLQKNESPANGIRHDDTRIRVLVSDPHPIVRKGIRSGLHEHPDFHVVAECNQLSELRTLFQEFTPDVVLLGHEIRLVSGKELLEHLPEKSGSARVILLSAENPGAEYGFVAIQSGVRGIFYRHQSIELLGAAVREVHQGRLWFDRGATESFVTALLSDRANNKCGLDAEYPLTMRQQRIVALVHEGKSNKEIAQAIWISQATVAYELTRIYRKLEVTDRIQLMLKMGDSKRSAQGQVFNIDHAPHHRTHGNNSFMRAASSRNAIGRDDQLEPAG